MDRKEMTRQYKETPRPAGVFAVRNTIDGTMLLGVSADLPGMLNRQRFQLELGSHPDRTLQADWNRLGPDAFALEILDELDLSSDPNRDTRNDLAALLQMWLEDRRASGTNLYPSSYRGN